VQKLERIHTLVIEDWIVEGDLPSVEEAVLRRNLANWKIPLRELIIQSCAIGSSLASSFTRGFPTLESISLQDYHIFNYPSNDVQVGDDLSPHRAPRLKSLTLVHDLLDLSLVLPVESL